MFYSRSSSLFRVLNGCRSIHAQASSKPVDRMEAWQIKDYKGLTNVQMASVRVPPIISPKDVLIKVHAASVNPLDVAIFDGYGKDIFELMRTVDRAKTGNMDCGEQPGNIPLSVGRDFYGEVMRVGHCVHNVSVGDMVCGVVNPQRQGSHAQFVVTSGSNVVSLSPSISSVVGCSFPYAGLTSWSAIVVSGKMRPNGCQGARVIVVGASGGIGTLAMQLLKEWGAEVTAVCSKDAFDLALACGASNIHDYKDPQTMDLLTSRPIYDLVLDASGKSDHCWLNSLKNWTGASYVTLSPPLLTNIGHHGLCLGTVKSVCNAVNQNVHSLRDGRSFKWAFYMPNPWALKTLTRMVENQQIKPVIDKVFPFDQALEAYQHVLDGPSRGKTVITMN